MRRVLVTGGSGFIGRHLVRALQQRVPTVLAPPRHELDVVEGPLPTFEVDHVFHLAGATGVPRSWREAAYFHSVNAQGTANILELCHQQSCSMSYVSGYCYGTPDRLPIRETDPMRPNNPYAFSKSQAEAVCRFYHDYFGVPITIIRPFNVYGPGQSDEFLLPRLVRQAIDPEVTEIEVTDLVPRRDYVYVTDVVDAITLTATPGRFAIFNVGSGRSYSVAEVVDVVLQTAGVRKPCRTLDAMRPREIPDVVADVAAIRDAVGWVPRVSLNEGVRRLIEVESPS